MSDTLCRTFLKRVVSADCAACRFNSACTQVEDVKRAETGTPLPPPPPQPASSSRRKKATKPKAKSTSQSSMLFLVSDGDGKYSALPDMSVIKFIELKQQGKTILAVPSYSVW